MSTAVLEINDAPLRWCARAKYCGKPEFALLGREPRCCGSARSGRRARTVNAETRFLASLTQDRMPTRVGGVARGRSAYLHLQQIFAKFRRLVQSLACAVPLHCDPRRWRCYWHRARVPGPLAAFHRQRGAVASCVSERGRLFVRGSALDHTVISAVQVDEDARLSAAKFRRRWVCWRCTICGCV